MPYMVQRIYLTVKNYLRTGLTRKCKKTCYHNRSKWHPRHDTSGGGRLFERSYVCWSSAYHNRSQWRPRHDTSGGNACLSAQKTCYYNCSIWRPRHDRGRVYCVNHAVNSGASFQRRLETCVTQYVISFQPIQKNLVSMLSQHSLINISRIP